MSDADRPRLIDYLAQEAEAAGVVVSEEERRLLSEPWISLTDAEHALYFSAVRQRSALHIQLIAAAAARRRDAPDFLDACLREEAARFGAGRESVVYKLAQRVASGRLDPPHEGWTLAALPTAFAGVAVGSLWSWWLGAGVMLLALGVYLIGTWRSKRRNDSFRGTEEMRMAVAHRDRMEKR